MAWLEAIGLVLGTFGIAVITCFVLMVVFALVCMLGEQINHRILHWKSSDDFDNFYVGCLAILIVIAIFVVHHLRGV